MIRFALSKCFGCKLEGILEIDEGIILKRILVEEV